MTILTWLSLTTHKGSFITSYRKVFSPPSGKLTSFQSGSLLHSHRVSSSLPTGKIPPFPLGSFLPSHRKLHHFQLLTLLSSCREIKIGDLQTSDYFSKINQKIYFSQKSSISQKFPGKSKNLSVV